MFADGLTSEFSFTLPNHGKRGAAQSWQKRDSVSSRESRLHLVKAQRIEKLAGPTRIKVQPSSDIYRDGRSDRNGNRERDRLSGGIWKEKLGEING
jgi:hypothetical protein